MLHNQSVFPNIGSVFQHTDWLVAIDRPLASCDTGCWYFSRKCATRNTPLGFAKGDPRFNSFRQFARDITALLGDFARYRSDTLRARTVIERLFRGSPPSTLAISAFRAHQMPRPPLDPKPYWGTLAPGSPLVTDAMTGTRLCIALLCFCGIQVSALSLPTITPIPGNNVAQTSIPPIL